MMHSKGMTVFAGLFLACAAAFIVFLSISPEAAPPPRAEARPQPAPAAPPDVIEQPEASVVEVEAPPPPPLPEPPAPETVPEPDPEPSESYGEIEGVVTRATVPQRDIEVEAKPDAATGEPAAIRATTDGEGRFRIERVPAGKCILQLAAADFSGDVQLEVMVDSGQVSEVQFNLPAASGSIEGSIHSGGVPIPDAEIEISIMSDQMVQSLKLNARDGHYIVDNLLPGVIGMTVAAERETGNRRVKTASFAVQEGQRVQRDFDFALPARVKGIISGIENDEKTTLLALHGVVDGLDSVSDPQALAENVAKITSPDHTGFYQLSDLEPGTYTIAIFSLRQDPDDEAPVYHVTSNVIDVAPEAQLSIDIDVSR